MNSFSSLAFRYTQLAWRGVLAMLKHIFQSRRESAALNNAVLARLQRVARDYSAVSEVVAEVERSSLSLLSDKRILEMMLCLCETELACPSPSIGPLLSATARLLGARGLYALLPRHPLQPLLRGCLPPPHGVASAVGEGPTRLGALLDLVLAIVRLPDASGDADEKLERAARAHFHLCGGAAALASLVGSLGTAAPRLRSLRREVGEPLLEILVSLLSTREASTEYGLTLSLCDGLSPQALDQLEIGGDMGRYGGDRPQALDQFDSLGCALSLWGIGSSVNSSRAARRSPCCGCAATHAARCGGARRRCCRRRCSSATRRSTFSEPSRNLPPGGAARVRRGAVPRRPALRRPLRRGCRGPPLPCPARLAVTLLGVVLQARSSGCSPWRRAHPSSGWCACHRGRGISGRRRPPHERLRPRACASRARAAKAARALPSLRTRRAAA